MDLVQLAQNHQFRKRNLPPHRIRAALRLDGKLMKITSREAFRESRTAQSWLEEMIRDLGGSYANVKVEQFRLIPDPPNESIEEEPELVSVVFVLDDGTRVKGVLESFEPTSVHRVSVREVDAQGGLIRIHDIDVQSILAAFFVRDLAIWNSGDPALESEADRAIPEPLPDGQRVTLTMVWGEQIRGDIRLHDARGIWYEFFTIDPNRIGNLKRALVSRRAIARVELIPSS